MKDYEAKFSKLKEILEIPEETILNDNVEDILGKNEIYQNYLKERDQQQLIEDQNYQLKLEISNHEQKL